MLFNWLHRDNDSSNNETVGEEVEMTEDELSERRLKLYKKIQRKQKIKKVMVCFLLLFPILGGMKSLFTSPIQIEKEEVADVIFATEYARKYYEYPKSDETKDFLDQFTLNNEESITYIENLEYMKIEETEFYLIESIAHPIEGTVYRYYGRSKIKSKVKDEEVKNGEISFSLDIAKKSDEYLVIRPVARVTRTIHGIAEEDVHKSMKLKPKTTNQTLDESEQESLKQTITLFLKTYNSDYEQAKLLSTDNRVIDSLDPTVSFELDVISSATQDDDVVYVQARIREIYSEFTSVRSYYIELNRENNKVRKMEVY